MIRTRQLIHKSYHFLIAHKTLCTGIILFVIALALRTINLDGWPRSYPDEGVYGYVGTYYFHGQLGSWYRNPDFGPPLLPWLCGLMTQVFGQSYFAIRLPGAFMGAISCVLIYFIVKKLYNHRTGIIASLMLIIATTYVNRVALMWNFAEFFLILTVYCYLKIRENYHKRWILLLGVSLGLGILSSFASVSALIFVAVRSFFDRKILKLWPAWLILAFFCIPIVLIAASMGWDKFLADNALGGRADLPPNYIGLLQFLIAGRPESQLAWTETLRFNIWSTIGFFSCFYLIVRHKPSDRIVLTAVASVTLVAFIIGRLFWWGHLAVFYPFYCISMAVAFHDLFTRDHNLWLLGIFTLPAIMLITANHFYSSVWTNDLGTWSTLALFTGFYIYLLFSNMIYWKKRITGNSVNTSSSNLFRVLAIVILAGILLSNAAYDFRNLSSNEAADQYATAEFLNSNSEDTDLVAASSSIVYLLKGAIGVQYTDVAFYTTHIHFPGWNAADRLPRYKANVSLDKMRYFVLDSPFSGLTDWYAAIVPQLRTGWKLVATFGDYKIYENPGEYFNSVSLFDDSQFAQGLWVSNTEGTDTINMSDDRLIKVSGEDSLRVEFKLTANNVFYHAFDKLQDWQNVKAFSFEWDGSRVGLISVDILAPDWNNYFHFVFTDNQDGWVKIYYNTDSGTVLGNPTWDRIAYIAYKFQNLPASGVIHLDDVRKYIPMESDR